MRSLWVLPISIFLAAMGLLVDAHAQSQDAPCYVAAGIENTHIYVRDLDMDDNPLDEIFSGWIAQGQQVPINSRTGKVDVNYRQASSDKTFGSDDRDCSNGRVISVP
jgi:hypothetical protein